MGCHGFTPCRLESSRLASARTRLMKLRSFNTSPPGRLPGLPTAPELTRELRQCRLGRGKARLAPGTSVLLTTLNFVTERFGCALFSFFFVKWWLTFFLCVFHVLVFGFGYCIFMSLFMLFVSFCSPELSSLADIISLFNVSKVIVRFAPFFSNRVLIFLIKFIQNHYTIACNMLWSTRGFLSLKKNRNI